MGYFCAIWGVLLILLKQCILTLLYKTEASSDKNSFLGSLSFYSEQQILVYLLSSSIYSTCREQYCKSVHIFQVAWLSKEGYGNGVGVVKRQIFWAR